MHIYLSAGSDAVDAAPITKDLAIYNFAGENKIDFSDIAGIGDGVNDLPFLRLERLGYIGAPKNAQLDVIKLVVSKENAFVSGKKSYFAFKDFYKKCIKRNIKYVFSDRDGVLIDEKNRGYDVIGSIFNKMGYENNPAIIVITGSSAEQNISFIENIYNYIYKNEYIIKNPCFIYAENGAIQINALNKSSRIIPGIDNALISYLQSEFKPLLFERLENKVLSKYKLFFSYDMSDQISKLYIPNKKTMVTINLPTTHKGYVNYRISKNADLLRKAILDAMVDVADSTGVKYSIL